MRTGADVCGVDGRILGSVGLVSAGRFQLERNGDVIWLPFDAVFTVEDFTVTLICDGHGVDRYAVPSPLIRRLEEEA